MILNIFINKALATISVAALSFTYQPYSIKKNNMKITPPVVAPVFTIKDVNDIPVNLENYKGKKVMLIFYRNVGCPVCNLRFHELQEQAIFFKSKELIMLAVYESTSDNMKKYLEGENYYATMIPNSDQSLYKLYEVEQSRGKIMKGMFHGAVGKMNKGKSLFKTKIKQDGNFNRLGAEFLIDENGNIHTAYYGKFLGDHLPIADIKRFID